MPYKDEIKAKIREIQKRMAEDESEKLALEVELNRLQLAEFEEDMKETQNQQFLKGQCCFKTTPTLDNFHYL